MHKVCSVIEEEVWLQFERFQMTNSLIFMDGFEMTHIAFMGMEGVCNCFLRLSVKCQGHTSCEIDLNLNWDYKAGRSYQIPQMCLVHRILCMRRHQTESLGTWFYLHPVTLHWLKIIFLAFYVKQIQHLHFVYLLLGYMCTWDRSVPFSILFCGNGVMCIYNF